MFIEDRLPKPYNQLTSNILKGYGLTEFNFIELAKRSRTMKYTDYFWIATDANKHEQLEDFHLLF